MPTIKDKARKPSPYTSPLFWMLPFITLIIVFSLVTMAQNISGFSAGLKELMETYKVALAIVSSCFIALLQWVISHHSSKPSELEVQQTVNRHLREEYSVSEQLFVKQFGKLVTDRSFSYITIDDLAAIHSKVYAEAHLIERGSISISDEVIRAFDHFFKGMERVLEECLNILQAEDDKESPNKHIKESVIIQLMKYSNQYTLLLHHEIGMKPIPIESSDINKYRDAFFETLHLVNYIGKELKPIADRITNTPSSETSNSQSDIQNMYEAAQNIATNLITSSEGATFQGIYRSIQLGAIIKQATGSKLYNLARQVIQDIVLEPLLDDNELIGAVPVDDDYPKYDIYNQSGDKSLTFDFT